jgi:GPH family glycoside/pentoside/hexuronide:cation symporter
LIAANYPRYGILSCLICWVMATINLRRHAALCAKPGPAAGACRTRPGAGDLTRDLLRTLGNRSFRNLLGYDIAMMAAYGVVSALNMLVWTYYWASMPRRSRSSSPCPACSPSGWCC